MSTAFSISYISNGLYGLNPVTTVTAVADINGDGKLDLVINSSGFAAYRLGNGDGTFQSLTYPTSGTLPTSTTTILNPDFNADGLADSVSTTTAGYITLLLAQNGAPAVAQYVPLEHTFPLDPSFTAGYPSRPDSVLNYFVVDLNNDGLPDLVVNAEGNQNGHYSEFSYAEVLINEGQSSTISGTVANQAIDDNQTTDPFSSVTITPYGSVSQLLSLSVTLDVASKGTFTNLSGGSYNSATGVYTLTGTAATLTAAMDALVYVPADNQVAPGTVVTSRFTIAVTDSQSRTIYDSMTSVLTTSVNDPPTIAGATPTQTIKYRQTAKPFANVVINDVDRPIQMLTVTVTLDDARKGSLSSAVGLYYDAANNYDTYAGSYNQTTGVYSLTGDAAGVTDILDNLVFTPTTDHSAFGGQYTTTFAISVDDGLATTVDHTTTVTTDIDLVGAAPADFFAKGKSDVLLQNSATGQCYVWEMDGTNLLGSGVPGWTPGAVWQAKGTGDFNGDGHYDTLLQNAATGDVFLWEQNGLNLVGAGQITPGLGPNWQERGIGDFNLDGKSDILFQNVNTGDCYIQDLNGTTIVGGGPVGWTPGANWQAKGVGDFYGDGYSDILFQDTNTGNCYIWEVDGTTVTNSGPVGWTPGANWQVQGLGDFNGDGKSDILLQNALTGDCYIWEMNGTNLVGSGAVGWTVGPDWKAAAVGDYNGDGKSDILLQNTSSGACYLWEMDGTNLIGSGAVGWTPGAVWAVKS